MRCYGKRRANGWPKLLHRGPQGLRGDLPYARRKDEGRGVVACLAMNTPAQILIGPLNMFLISGRAAALDQDGSNASVRAGWLHNVLRYHEVILSDVVRCELGQDALRRARDVCVRHCSSPVMSVCVA